MNTRKFRFGLSITIAALAFLWVGFARLFVRPMIEEAYRGEGFAFVNNYVLGKGRSLDEFLLRLDSYTQIGLLTCLGFGLLLLVLTTPAFFKKYVGEATAESVGIIRVLTCAIIMVKILWEDLPSLALMPPEATQPMGMIQLFYALPIGFEQFLASPISLAIFKYLSALIVFLGMIGWQTRIVLPLGTFCYLLIAGLIRHYSWFSHSGLVPLYIIAVLCFTPCSDSWSVDRLWKVYQGKPVPRADSTSPVYGWSRYACWTAISLTYVFSGLSKIANGGWMWWHPINMKGMLFASALRKHILGWGLALHLTSLPNWFFALMSIPSQFGEIAFGLALFSPTARLILPLLMMAMHIGIFFLMEIRFFDLLVLLLIFFDLTAIRKAIAQRLNRDFGSIQLLYDGDCPACSRNVRLLNCFDLFERLEVIDARTLDLSKAHARDLDTEQLNIAGKIKVISAERIYRRFAGFRILAFALPIFWVFIPCLFLPGISSLFERIYRYFNNYRPNQNNLSATKQNKKRDRGLRYSFLVSAIIVLTSFVWLLRIEFFPFTAWQMFSGFDNSGVFTYRKVFIKHESGKISRTYLEDSVGAMTNSRYRAVTDFCFEPEKIDVCNRFFATVGSVYNSKINPNDKAVSFELQLWEWDFLSHPNDSEHGQIVKKHISQVL